MVHYAVYKKDSNSNFLIFYVYWRGFLRVGFCVIKNFRFVKAKIDDDPDFILYHFGYNFFPFACKKCMKDDFAFCEKVLARVLRIPLSDFKFTPARKKTKNDRIELKFLIVIVWNCYK